mmetsp:Transcript_17389/g.69877  ORF Transcript_17389/g.69877 Transcript_17389/m.69877 type:complete len:230 (-) Transcript_17389:45-734(-)
MVRRTLRHVTSLDHRRRDDARVAQVVGAQSLLVGLFHERLDVGPHRRRVGRRRVAVDDVAVFVDEELGKVPEDRLAAERAGCALGEILEDRRGGRAVDVDLGEHGEPRERLGAGRRGVLLDLGVRARLLAAELVAREPEDLETLRAERLVERVQLAVVHLGEASLGRDVDHDERLLGALERVERERAPVALRHGEVEDRLRLRRLGRRREPRRRAAHGTGHEEQEQQRQ